MTNIKIPESFGINNYPKSYASINKEDYRLKDYLNLCDEELEGVYLKLERFFIERSRQTKKITEFKSYQFLNAGWEWSVFKKDANTVIKIPSGVFPEVNDPIYLKNSQFAYKAVVKFFPSVFVAKTRFYREDNLNIVEQEFINGRSEYVVDYSTHDKQLLTNLNKFFKASLRLVNEVEWMPDFWLMDKETSFLIRNVILEKETKLFKVIDFTQYLDPSRMYPAKTKRVVEGQVRRLNELHDWAERQLKSC